MYSNKIVILSVLATLSSIEGGVLGPAVPHAIAPAIAQVVPAPIAYHHAVPYNVPPYADRVDIHNKILSLPAYPAVHTHIHAVPAAHAVHAVPVAHPVHAAHAVPAAHPVHAVHAVPAAHPVHAVPAVHSPHVVSAVHGYPALPSPHALPIAPQVPAYGPIVPQAPFAYAHPGVVPATYPSYAHPGVLPAAYPSTYDYGSVVPGSAYAASFLRRGIE